MTKRVDIDAEMLMAYADGELSPIDAKRVERAMAADPDLRQQVDAHRKLRGMLANGFAPLAQAPVPERLSRLLAAPAPAPVVRLEDFRLKRRPSPVRWQRWGMGVAAAASLVVGLMLGQAIPGSGSDGLVTSHGGALVASGGLAQALDTQLAATQTSGAPTRVIVTFRDRQGGLCRAFSGTQLSGIACRTDNGWQLRETRAGNARATTAYAQAGSADGALLADAQSMMAGEPLDAAAEAGAKAKGWR